MNELISILIANGETIGVYKIDDNGYIDFGQWNEFQAGVVNLNSKLRKQKMSDQIKIQRDNILEKDCTKSMANV